MGQVVACDLTRLFLGPLSHTPRGIDRVDLALAGHFFASSDNIGVLPTPWGVRAYGAARVRRALAHLEQLWGEAADAASDHLWEPLAARLAGERAHSPMPATGTPLHRRLRRMVSALTASGIAAGRPVRQAVPRGAVYLNVGQIGLAVPMFLDWLGDRRDVTSVLMLHDVIPLDHPEQVAASSHRHHARMVRTAARHADGLIVTTAHAQYRIGAALAELGRDQLPTHVRRLPLPRAFAAPGAPPLALAGAHYFIVCATVEPRKNHALLLDVWGRLAARLGEATPHLIIVGAPGWKAGEILRPLAEDPRLRGRVHHLAGLSSPALARLMMGAAAVLCPSLAEGFGLPLLEANALNLPTIASDIGAHREIASDGTTLLPPDRAERWADAILAHGPAGPRPAPSIAAELGEAAYCEDIARFLAHCAEQTNAGEGVRAIPPSPPHAGPASPRRSRAMAA
jgi:glycosyltransferase involved in cell wall biosynthesis